MWKLRLPTSCIITFRPLNARSFPCQNNCKRANTKKFEILALENHGRIVFGREKNSVKRVSKHTIN